MHSLDEEREKIKNSQNWLKFWFYLIWQKNNIKDDI